MSPSDRPSDPTGGAKFLVHMVYGLYLLGLIISFPLIIGIIMARHNRPAASGTWLESHVTWQIRTFWLFVYFQSGVLVVLIVFFVANYLREAPLDIEVLIILTVGFFAVPVVWLIARVAKGWVKLSRKEPMAAANSLWLG